MKTRIAIGIIILAVGFTALSINYGWFNFNLNWSAIWNLWPLLLVLWGLSFLLPRPFRTVIGALTVLGLCVLIFAGIYRLNAGWQISPKAVVNQEFSADLPPNPSSAVPQASLEFDSGAGEFKIGGNSEKLLTATTSTSIGRYRLDQTQTGDIENLRLVMESGGYFRLGRNQNKAELALSPLPIWDLAVNLGAASGDFDLSGYKIRKTVIKSGASSLLLRLSEKLAESEVEIDTGASSVKILAPSQVAIELNADTGLVSRNFQGLEKVTDHLYRTPGFDQSAKKIRIKIQAGASSIELQNY